MAQQPPVDTYSASPYGPLMPQQLSQFTLPDFPIVGFVSNADADRATGQRVVRGEQYHTDHSNYPAPPRATALFGVEIPGPAATRSSRTFRPPTTSCRRR